MTLENLLRVTVLFICISLYLVIELKESKDEFKSIEKELYDMLLCCKLVETNGVSYKEASGELLSKLIHSECDKCSEEEMYLIGSTVLNRVDSPLFPNDLWSVIYSFRQFHGTENEARFKTSPATNIVAFELLFGKKGRNKEVLYFSGVNTLDVVPKNRIVKTMQFHKFYK